jgi:hypothetical protein
MSQVSNQRAIQLAEQQLGELAEEKRRLAAAEAEHADQQRAVAGELEEAWHHLVSVLVPSLEAAALDGAAGVLHLPGVRSVEVEARARAEKQRLEAQVAGVEADPRFAQRDVKRAELDLRLRELEDYAQPLRDGVRELEAEPVFTELVESGYGTPGYAVRWYMASYYRHWKYGDQVVDKQASRRGVVDFPALRRAYLEERDTLAGMEQSLDVLRQERGSLEALVRAREDALAGLANQPQRTLAHARERVRAHLSALEAADQAALLSHHPAYSVAVKRVQGVAAKQSHLEDIHQEWVVKPREQVQQVVQKTQRELSKLRRPKNAGRRWDPGEVSQRFRSRQPQFDKRHRRYQDTRARILAFNNYDRYEPLGHLLWWDLMTDGRVDGDFIPEVRHHHAHNPGWRDHFHHDRAVAALAGDDGHSGDVLTDAS